MLLYREGYKYFFFRRTLLLCLLEDLIASGAVIALVVLTSKSLLAIFNNDPGVISIGYTRLVMFFATYTFTMLYEMMCGYLAALTFRWFRPF